MATTYFWNWGGIDKIEVNDAGIIDENARTAFTRGQCHALALAIHRLIGAPIYGICDEFDSENSPGHCVVGLINGDYLDIDGVNALDRWGRTRPSCRAVKIEETKVYKLEGYMKPNVDAALPFARTLVAQYKNLLKERDMYEYNSYL